MRQYESSSFIKWRVVAVILIVAIVIQLVPSRFADYIWTKVRAAESDTSTSEELLDHAPDAATESSNNDPLNGKKELSVNGELTDFRTRNSKTYRLSDGSFYNTTFSYPIHIVKDNSWVDVDNTLVSDTDNARVNNINGAFDVSFPQVWRSDPNRSADNLIAVCGDGGFLSYILSLPGLTRGSYAESSAEILSDMRSSGEEELSALEKLELLPNLESGLKYSGVADGISLEYTVTPGGLKENIVIESELPNDVLDQGFLYSIDADDLTPELIDNCVVFMDDSGTPVFTFSAPLMYDSAGAVSYGLYFNIDNDDINDGITRVRLIVDTEWILDNDRVFPLVIDPEITVEGSAVIDSVATLDTSNNSVSNGVAVVGANKQVVVRLDWPELPPFALPVEANFVVNHGITANYSDCYLSATALNESWTVSGLANGTPAQDDYPFQRFRQLFYAYTSFTLDVAYEAKKNYVYGQNYGFMIESSGLASPITIFYASNVETTVLTVRYLNYQGLEDQWNTHAASVSDLSGTIYVKDAFGDFVYIHNDLSTPGDILPLSVSHIFNITDGNNNYGYGYGFRLSLVRTLQYNSDIEGYVYTDEDGTKHYFLLSVSNTYLLEEDPSVKVITDSGSPYIIWPDGSKLIFGISYSDLYYVSIFRDYRGLEQSFEYSTISDKNLLAKATDGAGNYLQFNYNSSGMLTSVNVNGSTTRKISFGYDNNRLSRITYPDSTYTQFYSTSRTVNGVSYYYPKRIVDPSGVMMRVAVSSGTLRVSRVYKKAAGSGDSTVVDSEYAAFEYEPSRTTVKYGYGSQQTYSEIISFDYYGRAANAIDDQGNAVILDYDENNNVFNNIDKSHSEMTAGPNYLKDSSFEASAISNWSSYAGCIASIINSGSRFSGLAFGSKCFNIFSIQSSGYAGYTQSVSLSTGTYTASAYCDATSGTGSGGAIIAFVYNDSNGATHIISSVPDKGNCRIQVTFTVPSGAVFQRILLGTLDFTGNIYFDAVQLEEGGRTSYYNAVENGGALYPTYGNWSGDVIRTSISDRVGYVMGIAGDYYSSKYAMQRINISKSGTDKQYMRLSGWYEAPSYFNNRNAYIRVLFYDASGDLLSDKSKIVYPDNNLTGWQYLSESFPVDFEFSYVKIYLNNYGPGYVYFDDVALTSETVYEVFDIDAEYTYNQYGWLDSETASDRSVKDYTYCIDTGSGLFGRVTKEELTDKNDDYTCTQYYYTEYFDVVTDISSVITTFIPADDNIDPVTTITEYKYGSAYTYVPEYYGHPTSMITKVREGNDAYKLTECKTTIYDTDTMLPESETDIWNHITEYSYNSFGDLTSVTENGNVTTYSYDSMGRITGTTGKARVGAVNNSTISVSFAYNAGRLSTITRANSYYGLSYDSLGRPLSVTVNRTSGGNTYTTTIASYTYSSINGKISILAYGNNKYKNYSYNTAGKVTAIDYSDTTGIDYTNAYSNAADLITRYNSLDNLTKNYSYDWSGRPVYTVFSNGRSLKYTYSDKSDESSVTFRGLASQPDKFTYKTYIAERYVKTTVSGNVTAFSYRYADEFGRLSNNSYGGSSYRLNTSYSYLSAGTYLENGTYTSFDKLSGRVGSVSFVKETVSSGATAAISGLPTLTYTYDAKGNIETISEGGVQKVKYYYDAQDQLIREDNKYLNGGTGYTVEYRYNADGNMTSKLVYTYTTSSSFPSNPISTVNMSYSASNGWRDQMTSYNGNSVTYDGAGNMLSYNNGAAMSLTWTQGNRLAAITRGSTQCSFIYDESGYRTRKTVGSTVYTYTWDGSRLVSQDTGTAGSEIVFLYDDSGNMFGFRKADNIYYYAKNLQGDVIAIFEITENDIDVVAKYIYDSWGRVLSVTGSQASTIGAENPIRYRSYYYDSETGLYYLKSRYYDPAINRFISADAFTSTGQKMLGYNMYAYCSNNPVCLSDFDGYFSWRGFFVGIAIAVIAVAAVAAAPVTIGSVAVGAAVATAGIMVSYAAATDSTIVIDVTGSFNPERVGLSLVIDFDNDHTKMELYNHRGVGSSDSLGVTISFGIVGNYTGRTSYDGFFIESGLSYSNIGSSYSFDPNNPSGATASCISISTSLNPSLFPSAGVSYDYYEPILYWEIGG